MLFALKKTSLAALARAMKSTSSIGHALIIRLEYLPAAFAFMQFSSSASALLMTREIEIGSKEMQ